MRTSSINKIYIFLFIIFIIGFICGLFLIKKIDSNLVSNVLENTNNFFNINNNLCFIIYHLIILSVLFMLSFFIIGIPFNIIYSFFNGISIGFVISIFFKAIGIKGIVYSIIYIIISKLLFLFFCFIFLKTSIKMSILIIQYIIRKNSQLLSNIYFLFKKSLLCIGFILINDIFLLLFGNNILKVFNFIIQ